MNVGQYCNRWNRKVLISRHKNITTDERLNTSLEHENREGSEVKRLVKTPRPKTTCARIQKWTWTGPEFPSIFTNTKSRTQIPQQTVLYRSNRAVRREFCTRWWKSKLNCATSCFKPVSFRSNYISFVFWHVCIVDENKRR